MRRLLLVFTGIIFCFFLFGVSFAAQVTVDLENLSPQDAAKVLEMQKQANMASKAKEPDTVKKIENWVDIGEKLGKAIAATCKELSVQVNDFIKTPVGRMTVAVILWKAVGKDLWHIVGGILCWMTITGIILWSFRFFHMKRKVEKKEGTEYINLYKFESSEAKVGSVWAHAIAFFALTLSCMLIVF